MPTLTTKTAIETTIFDLLKTRTTRILSISSVFCESRYFYSNFTEGKIKTIESKLDKAGAITTIGDLIQLYHSLSLLGYIHGLDITDLTDSYILDREVDIPDWFRVIVFIRICKELGLIPEETK